MKKIVLILGIGLLFCSCGKKSFLDDIRKNIEQEGCFYEYENIKYRITNNEYDLYECGKNGTNYLTDDTIEKTGWDIAFLANLFFDFSKKDANGKNNLLQELNNYQRLLFESGYDNYDYYRKTIIKWARDWFDEDICGRNVLFELPYAYSKDYIDMDDMEIIFHNATSDKECALNKTDIDGKSVFEVFLDRKCTRVLEHFFFSEYYSKNKKDYELVKQAVDNLDSFDKPITLLKLYENYYYYYNAPVFEPKREIVTPDFSERKDYPFIPDYEYLDGQTFTMVNSKLKVDDGYIDIPAFTKVKIIESVGERFIEDGFLVSNCIVECPDKKRGIMSSRYISYSYSELDLDNDGISEILLSNYYRYMSKDYICSVVVIKDGKSMNIEIPRSSNSKITPFDGKKVFFVEGTRIITSTDTLNDHFSNDSTNHLGMLSGNSIKDLGLASFYWYDANNSDHSILDFVTVNVVTKPDGLYEIEILRDINNMYCYDYYNYHFDMNERFQGNNPYKDAFDYYFDLPDAVFIYEEDDESFVIWGEGPGDYIDADYCPKGVDPKDYYSRENHLWNY